MFAMAGRPRTDPPPDDNDAAPAAADSDGGAAQPAQQARTGASYNDRLSAPAAPP